MLKILKFCWKVYQRSKIKVHSNAGPGFHKEIIIFNDLLLLFLAFVLFVL